jgi:ABC-type Na+ efflux pump permease subunit
MISNPVLRKELLLRFRMRQGRGAQAGVGLAVLLALGCLYYLICRWLINDRDPQTAQTAWQIVMSLQYLLVGLIAPSITANAITQEKEQQTWEMLVFTRLHPSEIIFGKLLARMASVLLLMLLFLPLMLFCWTRAAAGGTLSTYYVTGSEVGAVYLVTLVSALFFATFGLFASWFLKRTLYAIMASYTLVIGGLTISTVLVTQMIGSLVEDNRFFEKCPLMWINPVQMMVWAVSLHSPNTSSDPLYLCYGLLCYAGLTVLMLWRMIVGFRRFAYE